MKRAELKKLLDEKYKAYNQPSFIPLDPISIPHRFDRMQDREIIGFWTAMLAWGQRITIIRNAERLIEWMGGSPYDFILNHREKDRKPFLDFKHRTFNATDTIYFLEFLQRYYQKHDSLEGAFARHLKPEDEHVGPALTGFAAYFADHPSFPARTRKHVASPARKSSCKRLNMFLRWMVRDEGVDFGDWKQISKSQLLCPLDVHVERVARKLKLLRRKQRDFEAVLELTANLRKLDPADPVKYDFALFGIGILETKY